MAPCPVTRVKILEWCIVLSVLEFVLQAVQHFVTALGLDLSGEQRTIAIQIFIQKHGTIEEAY